MDVYVSKLRQFVSSEERDQARFDLTDHFKARFRENIRLAGAQIVSPVVVTWERLDERWIQRYHASLGRYAQNVSQFPRAGSWLVTVQAQTTEVDQ